VIGDIDAVCLNLDADHDSLMKRSSYDACHGKIRCPYSVRWKFIAWPVFVSGVLSDLCRPPSAEPSVRERDLPEIWKALCLVNG